jgi:hypothetical protein
LTLQYRRRTGDRLAQEREHHGARGTDRYALLLRPAKLVSTKGEFLCLLRDVSEGGAKVQLFHPLPTVQQVALQLANSESYSARPVWERGNHMGLRFDEPVDVKRLIQEATPHRKRPIRLKIDVPALITCSGVSSPAALVDLSHQGAQIQCAAHIALDQTVSLKLPGLANIHSKVRWRRFPAVGLVFEQVFRLDEFASLAAKLQDGTNPSGWGSQV